MGTWRELLQKALDRVGECSGDVVSSTITNEELLGEFDAGYGGSNGIPFTVWTAARVYFPVTYDGLEWVDSVARDPDGIPTGHIGRE